MKKQYAIFVREFFYFLSAALGVFLVLEALKPGFVIAYFNLNYWLILWVAAGSMLIYDKRIS